MKAATKIIDPCQKSSSNGPNRKLRVLVVDGSSQQLAVICTLFDLHDLVDVVGRATKFADIINLAVNVQPDLILMDIETPLASAAVAAITLSEAIPDVRIVGMCALDSIPPQAASIALTVSALIHKANFRREFLFVLDGWDIWRSASNDPLSEHSIGFAAPQQ